MSDASPLSQARASDDGVHVSGEIVREQTVRAPAPTPPPGTLGLGATGDTVRSPMPTPPAQAPMVPRSHQDTPADPLVAAEAIEEVELVEEVELLEDLGIGRDDPPAVSGEVRTRRTLRTGELPDMRRHDPRAGEIESGAVEVPIAAVGSDIIPTSMTSSGPQVVVPSGAWQRPSTDPGSMFVRGFSETTGPQPVAQAESTGPHGVVAGIRRARPEASSHNALWIVAGVLVLLAATVLGFVLTR